MAAAEPTPILEEHDGCEVGRDIGYFDEKVGDSAPSSCVRDVAELLSIQRVFQAINDCLCARHCLRFSESYPIFMRVRRYRSAERDFPTLSFVES